MDFLNSRKGLFILGIATGLVTIMLAASGNPKNMAICVACFIRDMSGSMRWHNAAVAQYFRPEIVGIVVGSFLISIFTGEYKVKFTSGSAFVLRFIGGITMVLGALVFLGCSTRMVLRMAAGDISAYIGLIGLALGVGTGALFLKKDYSLGEKKEITKVAGVIFPGVLVILLILSITTTFFVTSTKGPGSIHAPFMISLIGGSLVGILAQRSRMCFTGSFRNLFFMKNFDMIIPIFGMFLVVLIYNIAKGQFSFVPYGPIAHPQTIWNILGMYVVGLAGTLLGGCPLRQVVLAGQGSIDSVGTVLGMFVGAAMAHNFKIAAAAAAKATEKAPAVAGGPGINGQIAIFVCIIILLIIGFIGTRKGKINV